MQECVSNIKIEKFLALCLYWMQVTRCNKTKEKKAIGFFGK